MNEKMNNIVDDIVEKTTAIGSKAAEMAKNVGNRAGEKAEIAAVNLKIKKIEGEIRGIYRRIGEQVYKNESLEVGEKEDITPLIGEVDAKYVEIGEMKKNIESIKEKYAAKRDGGCCAEEEEKPEEDFEADEEQETAVCPVCGKTVCADDAFCPSCGTKL